MLAVFAEFERDILRERVKAGIARAREKEKAHSRPATAVKQAAQVKPLYKKGMTRAVSECI
jgi:DNA invertase Pin-like site-specific DNA recombinase